MSQSKFIDFPDARESGKANLLFLGRSGSGKTCLFAQFFRHFLYKQFDVVFCFVPTIYSQANKSKFSYLYRKDGPKVFIFSGFSDEKLRSIYKKIPENNAQNVLIVLDDCLSKSSFLVARHKQGHILNEIISSGRHKKVSLYILGQNTKSINTSIRDGMDGIVLLENSPNQVKTLCKDIVNIPISKFMKVFNMETQRKGGFVMVINTNVYTINGLVQ